MRRILTNEGIEMVFNKINDAYASVKNGLEAQVALATAEQKELLADAKLALAELKEMIADLKDENRSLQDSLKNDAEVKYGKSGAAWLKGEPYCAGCYGDAGKLIRLARMGDSASRCPKCSAMYRHLGSDAKGGTVEAGSL